MTNPLIVAMTGASGVIYGVRLLRILRELGVANYLIISKAAEMTIGYELSESLADVRALGDKYLSVHDVGAACASGSVATRGMLVVPCSGKSLAEIANGIGSNLIGRSAEVTLKERRRLVLMVRETPFTLSHIDNMRKVTEMGGIIAPPLPAFYTSPSSLDDIIDYSLGRVLELFGIDSGLVKAWRG